MDEINDVRGVSAEDMRAVADSFKHETGGGLAAIDGDLIDSLPAAVPVAEPETPRFNPFAPRPSTQGNEIHADAEGSP